MGGRLKKLSSLVDNFSFLKGRDGNLSNLLKKPSNSRSAFMWTMEQDISSYDDMQEYLDSIEQEYFVRNTKAK